MIWAVQIRPAALADVPRLAEVHVRSWQHGYLGLLPQDLLDGLDPAQREPRWRAAVEQAQWPRAGTLVAEDGGALLGFAALGPCRDTDQDPAVVGEVASFYIEPQAWRQGVGRSLMASSIRTLSASGYTVATLWVLDTNAAAAAFYRATGWLPDGASKHEVVGGVAIRDLRYRHPLG